MRNKFHTVRRPLAAAVLIAVLGITTACSGAPSGESAPAAQTVQETPTPTPTPSGTVIHTSKGSYLQAEVPDVTIDPALIEAAVGPGFTPEEIESGARFIIDFMVKHGIDSPLNGDGQTVDEWLFQHRDLFSSTMFDTFKNELRDKNGKSNVVLLERWQQEQCGAYQYIYSADTPRVHDLTITPTEILSGYATATTTPLMEFRADISFHMRVIPGVCGIKTGDQVTTGTMSYQAMRSVETGQWQIAGYSQKIHTETETE